MYKRVGSLISMDWCISFVLLGLKGRIVRVRLDKCPGVLMIRMLMILLIKCIVIVGLSELLCVVIFVVVRLNKNVYLVMKIVFLL